MHLRDEWAPPEWTELDTLCESRPFEAYCGTTLPSEHQRLICTACGHGPRDTVSHHATPHHHQHQQLQIMTPPEQWWEEQGRPSWTAPYVWETNY